MNPALPLRVLVVEDDECTRECFRSVIGTWGHVCEGAADGMAAIQAAPSFRPDVVLLDIGLPGMDGHAAAQDIWRMPGLSGVAVVAVTGHASDVDIASSYAHGYAAHLVKPVEVEELRALLTSIADERAGLKPDATSWGD